MHHIVVMIKVIVMKFCYLSVARNIIIRHTCACAHTLLSVRNVISSCKCNKCSGLTHDNSVNELFTKLFLLSISRNISISEN
jgi:hypothetical protein